MHHLVFEIDFQIHSVILTILVSIHLLIHFSTHLCHHPHSRRPSLLHCFTPGSKPTFSTNPFHRRFLLPTGLLHDNGIGPTYHAYHYGRPLSVSGRPCYILPMFLFFFNGRLILRPWWTEVRESFTRGGPWVSLEKLLLGFFPGHP